MKRAGVMISLIVGLTLCRLASAATTTINLRIINEPLSLIAVVGVPFKTTAQVQPMQFLPEVYVGNGTYPPHIIHVGEDSGSSDDPQDDTPTEPNEI